MRTLKFVVDGQIIKQDPNCDFSGLIPDTEGHLKAEFNFSSEWANCVKVVGFYSALGKEYPAQVLNDGKTCMIPSEALRRRVFKLRVVGKRGAEKLTTNKLAISQNGGKT